MSLIKFLHDDDWARIGVEIEPTEDPLFGPQVEARYRTIHQQIASSCGVRVRGGLTLAASGVAAQPARMRMTGFNEYFDSHLGGARMAVELARATAQELGLELSQIRWQRGHEVADLDSRSLVLGRGRASVCHMIPNGARKPC